MEAPRKKGIKKKTNKGKGKDAGTGNPWEGVLRIR